MRQQGALFSIKNDTETAIIYSRNRWTAFPRFLDDGRVCLSNNPAELALRTGPSSALDVSGDPAAAFHTVDQTCKMMMSIRRPGWPTCWRGLLIITPANLGIGEPLNNPRPQLQLENALMRLALCPGLRRMRTLKALRC
jgi:hypothetical protein